MSKPTTQEWKVLEDSIGIYVGRKLKIDGHIISVYLVRSGMRLIYEVFVDGSWKGKYLSKESDMGKKYLNRQNIRKHDVKYLKAMEKIYGKRRFKKEFPKPNEIVTIGYTPFFKSFKTMKKTWMDNNDNIEILPAE